LRPWRPKDEVLDIPETKFTIDVRFHLTKSLSIPELNTVVKALQWIPFVQLVRMQKMSSPAHELSDFIWKVNMAKILRPVLTRFRRRRELRQALQLQATDSAPSTSPPSPLTRTTSIEFLKKEPREVELFDWSKAELFKPKPTPKHDGHVIHHLETESQPVEVGPKPRPRDAALPVPEGSLQRAPALRLSQRALDRLLFFALGILAPTLVRWATQGCASPFAGSC
jgi:hypothetical protein